MIFTRRAFFALFFRRPVETASLPVKVLETFTRNQAPSAILVHHADEASRDSFARWLRANPRAFVRVRDRSGKEADATIFRVRLCFGRGLILMDGPIQISEGDVVTLISP